MARVGGMPLPTITDDRALGGAKIERSLRFTRGDSSYLSRALGSPTSDDKASVSVWLKRTTPGTDNTFFDNYQGSNDRLSMTLVSSTDGDKFSVYQRDSSGIVCNLLTTQVFRDSDSWYHFLIAFDTTQSTAADRVKIYVNGTQITAFDTETYFSQNHNLRAGSGYTTNIGRYGAGSNYFDGYLAELNYIDGQQLSPTDVGFTDSQTGIWMPKRYEGTYGNNGFYLDFNDRTSTTTLGIDKSPNGNDFTLTNLAVSDSMLDTPSNNFPTLRLLIFPPSSGSTTITQGNLRFRTGTTGNGGGGKRTTISTMAVKSGKWYFEVIDDSEMMYGIGSNYQVNSSDTVDRPRYILLDYDGIAYYSGGYRQYGDTNGYTADSDISQIYVDMDAPGSPVIYFGRNGQWGNNTNNTGTAAWNSATPINGMRIADYQSDIFTNQGDGNMVFLQSSRGGGNDAVSTVNFGQDSTFTGQKSRGTFTDANGRGEFQYQPPRDALALCAANLPMDDGAFINPKEHFAAVTYTGAQSSTKITGLLFEPDMIWCKSRTQAYSHYIFDRLRGLDGSHLIPNSNAAEGPSESDATALGGTHASGFFISSASGISDTYQAPNNYVAWCWKAGGAAVTNNDGNTTSQVSVNQKAGFSIVTYAGSGQPRTIGHGLGKKPAWIMSKSRDSADDWMVWHKDMHTSNIGNYSVALNSTGGRDNASQYWYDTEPTSTVFTRGNYSSGDDMIAYCWTEITGFSKFGFYKGNANSDGPEVHLGFRPAWLMIRRVDSGDNWIIKDSARNTTNDVYFNLNPNSNGVQNGSAGNVTTADFYANGFKIRGSDSGVNASTGRFIYMAFAEGSSRTPFSTFTNAR
jgi:hypothetical protein